MNTQQPSNATNTPPILQNLAQNNYICDTNCFYHHSQGKIDLTEFRRSNGLLYYSPLSVIELLGKLDEHEFLKRQKAAMAILDVEPILLPDPDANLSAVFGFGPPQTAKAISAYTVLLKFTQAQSVSEVEDDVNICREWRQQAEHEWLNSTQALLREYLPNVERWEQLGRLKNRRPLVSSHEEQAKLASFLESVQLRDAQLNCLYQRALTCAPKSCQPSATSNPRDALDCYMKVYSQLIYRVLTTRATRFYVKPNDSHDIEFFLYSTNDDKIFLTAEDFWCGIARDCSMERRVHKLQLNHP